MKSHARGLSLIEVVIGMALLGLFLASIFIAQAKLTRQSVIARKKALAISATDTLLAGWATDWANFPTDDTGTIPDHDNLQWQTQSQQSTELEELGILKVQLAITDTTRNNADEPILQLELAVPMEEIEDEASHTDESKQASPASDSPEPTQEVSP
ncbi:MAG: prepilin-type N-terminal cleavage/methylation domain-containing protein [Phycisphaeraceae bacterium JB051]